MIPDVPSGVNRAEGFVITSIFSMLPAGPPEGRGSLRGGIAPERIEPRCSYTGALIASDAKVGGAGGLRDQSLRGKVSLYRSRSHWRISSRDSPLGSRDALGEPSSPDSDSALRAPYLRRSSREPRHMASSSARLEISV